MTADKYSLDLGVADPDIAPLLIDSGLISSPVDPDIAPLLIDPGLISPPPPPPPAAAAANTRLNHLPYISCARTRQYRPPTFYRVDEIKIVVSDFSL